MDTARPGAAGKATLIKLSSAGTSRRLTVDQLVEIATDLRLVVLDEP